MKVKVSCCRCNGSGVVRPWGTCFNCNGAGFTLKRAATKVPVLRKFCVGFKWLNPSDVNFNNGDYLICWGAQKYKSKPDAIRKAVDAMYRNGSVETVVIEQRVDQDSGAWYSLMERDFVVKSP